MKIIKFKKLKFKNDCLTVDKYNQIIFEGTSKNKYTKPRRTIYRKYVSYYKGESKNGKANGWGIEILKYNEPLSVEVEQYYEGEWKNGERDGYGEEYDHYPTIGPIDDPNWLDVISTKSKPKIKIAKYKLETSTYYRGNWLKGNKNGNGEHYSGSLCIRETGVFKDNKLWSGKKEELKFKDYVRNIFEINKGKIKSTKVIKEKNSEVRISKRYKVIKTLFSTIIENMPKKFQDRFDKKNFLIYESDPNIQVKKPYNYKDNKVYFKFSLDDGGYENKKRPSTTIMFDFLCFSKGYKKGIINKTYGKEGEKSFKNRELVILGIEKGYVLKNFGQFSEVKEMTEWWYKNNDTIEKKSDKKLLNG